VSRCILCLLLTPLAALPVLALSDPGADELQESRAQLEQWRKHPDQMARLLRDLQAFLALPEARREQILKLDHDLQEESAASRARLLNVLERYVRWLERLPQEQRQAIENAPDASSRLALIQELRDGEWMQRQPRAIRERWAGLKETRIKVELVLTLRQDEHRRHQEWALTIRFWDDLQKGKPLPRRFADLDPQDREGVKEFLMPMLTEEEKGRLKQAEGRWPDYPRALVEIADRHPFALPGANGPRSLEDLPKVLQARLSAPNKNPFASGKYADLLRGDEGRWPRFAIKVAEVNRQYIRNPLPRELWASTYKSLLEPMRAYVDNVLKPVLSSKEAWQLEDAETTWPAYPEMIGELARAHKLPPPPWATALSGPRERWDNYRSARAAASPPAPKHVLRDFALSTLDARERARLRLSVTDPGSLGRLQEEWARREETKRVQRENDRNH
jgi:hypothetical protein